MCGIYKITNLINGKVYIGQSVNIEKRWAEHRSRPFQCSRKDSDKPLYRAIRKYGLEHFNFSVIEECLENELNSKEIYWIKFYNAKEKEYGYNLTDGGEGTRGFEIKLTKQQVDEIYTLLIKTCFTQEEIAKKYDISQCQVSLINNGLIHIKKDYSYPLRTSKVAYYCQDCGKEISRWGNFCIECTKINQRKVDRPNREELKLLIRETSFVKIAEKYSVSDNAIRKWCDYYHLPRTKKEIKKYTDEEWEQI